MTFDTVEASIQSATPVELYDFVYPTVTYRRTSNETDVVFGGHTYTAVPGGRASISIADIAGDATAVSIELVKSDAVITTWTNGVPPSSLQITVTRYYPADGVQRQVWSGTARDMSIYRNDRGLFGQFKVPSGTADSLAGDCPSVTLQRHCNHRWGDGMCNADGTQTLAGSAFSSPFSVTRTISSISADGKTIIVNAAVPNPLGDDNGNPVPWSLHGAVQHAASQEQRTVIGELTDQVTLTLMTQFPNGVIHVGDSVTVVAGCAGTMRACSGKFANGINFGGDPYLPPDNIFYVGLTNAKYRG